MDSHLLFSGSEKGIEANLFSTRFLEREVGGEKYLRKPQSRCPHAGASRY
ncbi:hypothetical protein BRE01_03790 [Brevibacillus reuszeri]|uniref:Uncharacterized protein n=1 Tax=Brevibacillus reuszeri TaxID=54915 RepID=A0ABQ0TFW9_9BACL|nr:hypothetical protein BRE01_03790 [Brevibacillus reuszeri]